MLIVTAQDNELMVCRNHLVDGHIVVNQLWDLKTHLPNIIVLLCLQIITFA